MPHCVCVSSAYLPQVRLSFISLSRHVLEPQGVDSLALSTPGLPFSFLLVLEALPCSLVFSWDYERLHVTDGVPALLSALAD